MKDKLREDIVIGGFPTGSITMIYGGTGSGIPSNMLPSTDWYRMWVRRLKDNNDDTTHCWFPREILIQDEEVRKIYEKRWINHYKEFPSWNYGKLHREYVDMNKIHKAREIGLKKIINEDILFL